jgi:hypothetical protein
VVMDFVAVPSTKPSDYGTKSCIDEANKTIYIDLPKHIVDSALIFKVILGIGARCEPASFSAMKLDSINYLTVIAESGKTSKYKIVRLKNYKYTDSQIFTATISNVINNIKSAPVSTSFMIGSSNGKWGSPYDAVIYIPSTADTTKLKISLSLNDLTSYKAGIYGPCNPDGPFGSSLDDKNLSVGLDDNDGPLYDSTRVYSSYQVPVTYDPISGTGLAFKPGILFRSISYSGTTLKYYRLRIVKSKDFDSTLTYYDPAIKIPIIKKKSKK